MNPQGEPAATAAEARAEPLPATGERLSLQSSSSVGAVKRSASLKDAAHPHPHTSPKPHSRATPPSSASSRRRSSAANGAAEAIALLADHEGKSHHQPYHHHHHHHHHQLHHHQPSYSRRLSVTSTTGPANGPLPLPHDDSRIHSSPPARPSKLHNSNARSPTSSPRRSRPRSPAHDPPPTGTAPPRLPKLPPVLLPSTVYDPNTPTSSSAADSPSQASLFAPNLQSVNAPRDYFNSKPTPPQPPVQRPPSRTRVDKVLAKSPLASPAILNEADPRHDSASAPGRPSTARRPSVAAAAVVAAAAAAAAATPLGHRHTASRQHAASHSKDHSRTASRTHATSPSRDHNRSESNTSAKLDDHYQGTPPRTRERREKDKKTMLSRALQKANTAVLLDNAQNFEGAMEAYEDACKLLQQVMVRSSQEEDRRKLDAIRVTYTNRIEELRRLDPAYTHGSGKSLPARPMSGESLDEHRSMLLLEDDDEEPAVIQTASVSRIVNDASVYENSFAREPEQPPCHQLPLRSDYQGPRESVISTAIRDVQKGMQNSQFSLQPPPARLGPSATSGRSSAAESAMDRTYMPPPLSPRRSKSPLFDSQSESRSDEPGRLLQPQQTLETHHRRAHSNESTSWLDTIDESGGSSCSSSVHSMSPGGPRRKHLRNPSGETEAEFDAALDAAVEAAYDDGYEPYDDDMSTPADLISAKMRNVEMAKERVREAEREEAIAAAKYRYKENQVRNEALPHVRETAEITFNDEAEEEERLLDEMTREYMLDGFDFDLQTKSALPRQSDSSNFSASTHNSSVSSHRTTGGTSLSTVTEVAHPPSKPPPVHSPPAVPAPSGALPALPPVLESQASNTTDAAEVTPRPNTATKDAASVRSRRLSGQNAKSLKIETSVLNIPPAPHTEKPPVPAKDVPVDLPAQPKSAAAASFSTSKPSLDSTFKLPALPQIAQQSNLAAPSPQPALYSPSENGPSPSPMLHSVSSEPGLVPGSPKTGKTPALGIRKNKSSLSLKQRNLSMSSPDGSDVSIGTPLSTTFSVTGRKPSNAGLPIPTPSLPTFNIDGLPSGGMHLFESDIHSPFSPGSPSPAITNAPIPLEPCPDSYLLRPFWLMRCFYQTIAHPRGGYLSTKLFIPRDVWRVKGVKLKNVEDKIANCDMLTAALQKLAAVDTNDADAVLEEMQSLELVLDQVQAQLAKKLGNEVGIQSVSILFKDATTVGEGAASADGFSKGPTTNQDFVPKGAVAQGKSYLASWRKLRSKNSGVNLANMVTGTTRSTEVPKDTLLMATLPMTSLTSIRFAKRDISGMNFEGPNAGYMGSLARLFDAVQILDQIARQVEDPGLKHSSPTHVGLELSTRHAAEFFGFYICRFVLSDVTLMLDKFIKRGSEWVLV
ncbi:hypothetical protein COCC4DRAFT_72867 [Bipolaris maydis ATCC 48331]|uniref:MIT domain-containing protein n=2 Tax=Cochliobolus heterostrophus TaxID=5016 RepID=M2VB48_COCH5|nr:uncharacterized protein COCC4DRAFT_72867 [Bipolaris maydis ATCC 48331]EMD97167.1 hypothetical protein COCHEDRAFT_1163726 [Bipolaris maydis C5]ENI04371.1 hypothetical protein COCC4DRAFT_72867 [Bipolaris maydis ATCC 48331]KAJ6214601.1 hypothetical protein PSV09DRAFT_1163726 [Bipolaris maydis]KAJ6275772.1 hypothetical protein PSV08DRAFT_192942 [Bipolaris maydis]